MKTRMYTIDKKLQLKLVLQQIKIKYKEFTKHISLY